MPRLDLPFAVVGAAAGWLAANFFDNPIAGVTPSHAEGLAAACSAAVAALVGATLHKRCAPVEHEWLESRVHWLHMIVAVLGGGAASGMIVGALHFANARGAFSGLFAGLAAAVAFMPVCALVVAAARRAARARLGSLVAEADLREMWGIMAAALAVATCAALPDALFGVPSLSGLLMSSAAGGLVAGLLVLDLVARLDLRRAVTLSASMTLREEGAHANDPVPDMDFGLGDTVWARAAQAGAGAYRAHTRTAAVVIGDPNMAAAALRRAMLKKLAGVAVATIVVFAHCFMPYPPLSSFLPDR